jgi:Rrf2 family iron-sulfur cluster assembly transcriptional regulator
MKLTTRGRYAVMAMVDLAEHSAGRPVCLAEIAERQRISLSYLEQLFCKLRREGLVRSVRGPGGGYLLQHGAGDTRIADIVMAVDAPWGADAEDGLREGAECCRTRDLWRALGRQMQVFLCSVSLADVIERRLPAADEAAPAGKDAAA